MFIAHSTTLYKFPAFVFKVYIVKILQHMEAWPQNYPVCVHAEGRTVASILMIAHLASRPVHVCHVSSKEEILLIRAAKSKV